MSKTDDVPFWKRAANELSARAEEISSHAQQLGTTAQEVADQLKVKALEAQDSLGGFGEQAASMIQNVAESTAQQAQALQREGAQVVKEVQESALKQSKQVIEQVDGALKTAGDKVADQIDAVAGERGESVSNFVREGGLLTVAGFAFRPISLARRGVDSYHAYRQFMSGEVTLGVFLLNLISPSIIDTQSYLSDPKNQVELLEKLEQVIPLATLKKLFGPAYVVGGQLSEAAQEGPLTGEALKRFQELMSYRRPQSSAQQAEGETVESKGDEVSDDKVISNGLSSDEVSMNRVSGDEVESTEGLDPS